MTSYDSSFTNNEDFQTSMDRDHSFSISYAKTIVIGEPSVGKSSIILSFTENQFKYNLQATCGVDFNTKTIKIDEKNDLKMQIWDTAGQEKYRSLIANYFKNSHGALLVFDLTSRKSFQAIKNCWFDNLKKFAPENICKVALANKCDKTEQIEVSNEEIEQFEKENNIICFRTSAKECIGISEAFLALARLMNENFLFVSADGLKNKSTFEKKVEQEKVTLSQLTASGIRVSRDKKNKKTPEMECC